jgi:hypothetical protein
MPCPSAWTPQHTPVMFVFVTDGLTPWMRLKNPCLAQLLSVGIGNCSK